MTIEPKELGFAEAALSAAAQVEARLATVQGEKEVLARALATEKEHAAVMARETAEAGAALSAALESSSVRPCCCGSTLMSSCTAVRVVAVVATTAAPLHCRLFLPNHRQQPACDCLFPPCLL